MARRIILALAALIVIAGAYGIYLYTKPTADLEKAKADFSVDAESFFLEFSGDESAANEKYVGKVIEVTGPVASISNSEGGVRVIFLLDDLFGISCSVDSAYAVKVTDRLDGLGTGDEVTVRGRCNGMLTDVQLSSCVLVKK